MSLSDLSEAEVATVERSEFDSRAEADQLVTSLQERQVAEELEQSEGDSLTPIPDNGDPSSVGADAANGASESSSSENGSSEGRSEGSADEVSDVTNDSITTTTSES